MVTAHSQSSIALLECISKVQRLMIQATGISLRTKGHESSVQRMPDNQPHYRETLFFSKPMKYSSFSIPKNEERSMCWESQAVVEVYNSNHFVIRCKSPFHGKRILNSALKNRHICYRSDFRHPKTYDSNNLLLVVVLIWLNHSLETQAQKKQDRFFFIMI